MSLNVKLSPRVHQSLGNEIANELVQWLEASAWQRTAELDVKWHRQRNELETNLEQRLRRENAEWERRLTELRTEGHRENAEWERRFHELRTEVHDLRMQFTQKSTLNS